MSEGVAVAVDDQRSDSVAVLAAVQATLARLAADADDAVRVEQLRVLEQIKAVAAAAQARVAAAFVASQHAQQLAAGIPAERASRGVTAQVALALRTSPYRAQRYCGWATILTTELPATWQELTAGRTTEWRAILVARESATLSRPDRAVMDAELAPRLTGWGDARVEAEARRVAYRLDPAGFTARTASAINERRVTLRPAPDTMCRLTALLPVAQGVAAYAALLRHADTHLATGIERSGGRDSSAEHDDASCVGGSAGSGTLRGRGQVMADTLVERLTGQASADAVPVEVSVLIGVDTLLGADDEPAEIPGYGPIPAPLARRLAGTERSGDAAASGDADAAPRWVRRLFTRPTDGALLQMETHRRTFTTAQRRFINLRDRACRTPWCDAPIRHTDHIVAADHGGVTGIANAQGLCAACNHAKQAPGWHARPGPHGTVDTRTPTGHRYLSRPPDPPGWHPSGRLSLEAEPRGLPALQARP